MATLKSIWKRIAKWHRSNLPDDLRDSWEDREFLNEGATKIALQEAEEAIGLGFPKDLKESYLLWNGSRDEYSILPWGYYLLTLSEIVDSCASWKAAVASGVWDGEKSNPKGSIRPVHWNTSWIPISANGGGDHQCVDLDPAPRGKNGQVIRFNHEVGPISVLASSFKDWLSEYADALEAGEYEYDSEGWSVRPLNQDDD